MDPAVGLDAKLYYAVGGVGGSFQELADVTGDPQLSVAVSEIPVPVRGRVLKEYLQGQLDFSVSFDILARSDNAGLQALRQACLGRLPIGIRMLDRENGEGPELNMGVFGFDRKEPLEDGVVYTVTLKPRYSSTGGTVPWIEPS